MSTIVRPETPGDHSAVAEINEQAFEGPVEATIVARLRNAAGSVSLVAAVDGTVVGHLLLSRVVIEDAARPCALAALGPMAVAPDRQRSGVGGALVREAIGAARRHGYDGLVLVGHPEYYPRLGFQPGSTWGLRCEFDVPDDVFMAMALEPGALDGVGGLIRFDAAFHEG
jgi:putative acetyltransferase